MYLNTYLDSVKAAVKSYYTYLIDS